MRSASPRTASECVSIWSGILHPPQNGDQASDDAAFDRLIEGLTQICDFAASQGVLIRFEPEPGMFIDSMRRYEELLARFDHPALRLTIDIGHLHCLGETPIAETIRHWASRLVNVHIEDMARPCTSISCSAKARSISHQCCRRYWKSTTAACCRSN